MEVPSGEYLIPFLSETPKYSIVLFRSASFCNAFTFSKKVSLESRSAGIRARPSKKYNKALARPSTISAVSFAFIIKASSIFSIKAFLATNKAEAPIVNPPIRINPPKKKTNFLKIENRLPSF